MAITRKSIRTLIFLFALQLCSGIFNIALPDRVLDESQTEQYTEEELIIEENIQVLALESASNYTYAVSENNVIITRYAGAGGTVTIPDTIDGYTVTSIASKAFSGCTGIQDLTLPSSLTSIGYEAFSGCTSLQSVSFTENSPNGYSLVVGTYAFANCISLSEVEFSKNVTEIGNNAFFNCASLKTLILPENLTTVGYDMIAGTKIESITIPKSVTN